MTQVQIYFKMINKDKIGKKIITYLIMKNMNNMKMKK